MTKEPLRLNLYLDVKEALDVALSSGGAEVTFTSPGKAINFRQRCYTFRKAWAKSNPDSPYDRLTLPKLEKDDLVVRIIFQSAQFASISPIGTPTLKVLDDEEIDGLDLEELE